MTANSIELIATCIFALAVLHTFLSSSFQKMAHRYPEGSIQENLFHLLGEVEVVFGLWAGILLIAMGFASGYHHSVEYAESLNFTEPLFVFAIMAIAATRPVIELARRIIFGFAKILPVHRESAIFVSCLVIGPIAGSFITEPAAMTVTALILRDRFFHRSSDRLKYITLAVLFVNVSIGGVLTPFAAPPVLMVASKWGWDLSFMLSNFGWKAAVAVVVNAIWAYALLRKELSERVGPSEKTSEVMSPAWLTVLHLAFLAAVVVTAHHPVIFVGLFLFFLGVTSVTKEYQSPLLIKQSLLVAFFLAGLVVIGGLQKWWLQPLLASLDEAALFFGATALTAVTDNAALTYLGSQIDSISEGLKYALVAGAVSGGGLTVIANAPNPAGFAILQSQFGPAGVKPLKLFVTALIPTAVACAMFFLFRS